MNGDMREDKYVVPNNNRIELTMQLVRLLNYVVNMQEDHPELDWPDLPDQYGDLIWRYCT